MWVKNGARTLPVVLNRLNSVIPCDVVGQKIIVDDGSVDDSVLIAKFYGWRVVCNRGRGISDGANTALGCVGSEFFASFEQDVLVSPLWFKRVSILLKEGVVVASGLRFLPRNSFCYSIDSYLLNHNSGDYGKTLDNTIYNTEVLRGIGGFPKVKNAFAETVLHHHLKQLGYVWQVDYGVWSLHLHGGLWDELRHYFFYGANLSELQSKINLNTNVKTKFLRSPVAALRMAYATGDPKLILSYPLCRLAMLGGYLHGGA